MSTLLYTSEGWMDLEEHYVPGCVAAELPDGRAEAMRALAVAARTYVLRAMADDKKLGTEAKPIPNHGRFQVFQRNAPASVREVTLTTRSIVCRYKGLLLICNHVIGAPRDASGKPILPDMTDTEQYVTNNSGKTGSAVKPSSISNPSRPDNRGCMSARGADWLASTGHKYASILRYFYGEDVFIAPIDVTPPSPGPVIIPTKPQGPSPKPQDPLPQGPTLPEHTPIGPAEYPSATETNTNSGASFPLPLLAIALAVIHEGG